MTSQATNLERTAEQKVMDHTTSPGIAAGSSRLLSNTAIPAADMSNPAAAAGNTCSRTYFTTTEDRPIVREQVTYVKEHHPVQKEFVVESKPTGRVREVQGAMSTEVMNTVVRSVPETVISQSASPRLVASQAVPSTFSGSYGTGTTMSAGPYASSNGTTGTMMPPQSRIP